MFYNLINEIMDNLQTNYNWICAAQRIVYVVYHYCIIAKYIIHWSHKMKWFKIKKIYHIIIYYIFLISFIFVVYIFYIACLL